MRRQAIGAQKCRGVALITAMLITAVATVVAANLAWDNALDVRRTMSMLNRDQAMQVALGAESWVSSILKQDAADTDTDHLGEIWASEMPGLPIEGGEVFGSVVDLQGRFNLNNLVDQSGAIDEASLEQFRRLLRILEIDPRLAGITADWIDANREAGFPDGAEDPIYTRLTPPYRPANQFLTSPSELAAVEGMDKEALDRLAPHVTALPGRTAINVNTATPAVLQSLAEEMSAADVEALLVERQEAGFPDFRTAFSSYVPQDVIQTLLVEDTNYFQLRVVVRIDTVRFTLYSVLLRADASQGGGAVTPILRSFGTT